MEFLRFLFYFGMSPAEKWTDRAVNGWETRLFIWAILLTVMLPIVVVLILALLTVLGGICGLR